MRAGAAGMLALAALLAGCGSLSGSEMSRRTDADIEVARQRQADEKAELTSPGTYLSLIRRMQEQGMYYASLAHIDAYVQRLLACLLAVLLLFGQQGALRHALSH
ncbi:pilus assembly protein TadD, partial [Ralstonia pseudosolanacearum]